MTHKGKHEHPNRRYFLSAGFSAAFMSAMSVGCFPKQRIKGAPVNMKSRLDSVFKDGGEECLPATGIYPDMPGATVGIRGVSDSIEKAVRETVGAAGGLDEIEPGQRVMIKPNMNGPASPKLFEGPINTHPEVVRAVIKLVKERGAHAMVGDRSMFMTEQAIHTTGFGRVCKEEGAEPFPWTHSEYVRFHPQKRHWSNGFRMPKILNDVDHFINVPVLKDHTSYAEFTCCLKSYVGVCMPFDRWMEGPDALHQRNISEKIAELNLAVKPTINIVDATSIMIKGGPGDGLLRGDPMNKDAAWAHPNLVLASKDRVACDSVALAVLKHQGAENNMKGPYVEKSVWDNAQIYYSAELGIGQADPEKITIEDIDVNGFDEIKDNWK